MNRKKYLAKNTALFALNNLGTKLIVFFLVPVYTNALNTAEYGIVDLVTTLATIIVPIIVLNINEAIQRFCLDENANQYSIMSIGLIVILFSLIFGLAIIPLTMLFKSLSAYSILLYLYCITQGCFVIFSSYLRGTEKLNHFAIASILTTFISAILNVLFLIYFKSGISGYFWAFITAYIVGSSYAFVSGKVVRVFTAFSIEHNLAKKMLVYSVVLVPNTLMWWIMNTSDRIMVISMVGLAENGIYAISYKVPSLIFTMSTVFNQAWSFSAIKEEKSNDRDSFNVGMYNNLFFVQLLITVFLISVIKIFITVYVSDAYYSSWRYSIPLLIGYFFMSLGTFLSVQYTVNKDSKGFLVSGSVGALVNVFFNFVLIPTIGALGAAIATMFSYICVFAFRAKDTQKYLKIPFFDSQKILLVVLMTLMGLSSYITTPFISYLLTSTGLIAIVVILRKQIVQYCFVTIRIIRKLRKRVNE